MKGRADLQTEKPQFYVPLNKYFNLNQSLLFI